MKGYFNIMKNRTKNFKLNFLFSMLMIINVNNLSNVYADKITNNNSNNTSLSNNINGNNNISIPSNKVMLNFDNVDIQVVIKAISQLSGKNFVVDPRVKGNINIISDKPIAKEDSYLVLESALRMQGFASVESDGVIKVLPETDTKTYGMQTFSNTINNSGDQVVTKIFVLTHGSANQLLNTLRPLIAPNNSITVYPNSNALVITDYASNLKRITKIINDLNNSADLKPEIIYFKHAIASDVANTLQSYIQGGGTASPNSSNNDGPNVTITVDSVNNSIILYSLVRDKLQELKTLALNIDNNTGINNNIHVVYLKNGDANHIADVLRVVANNQENPDLSASSANSKFNNEPGSVFAANNNGSSNSSSKNNSPRSQTNNNTQQKDAPKIFIQAEPSTNSLIIQAPDAMYKNLRMVIEMLDVRRAQVMIEALLVTMSSSKTGTFGVQWLVGGIGNNGFGGGIATNYGGNNSSISNLATQAIIASKGGTAGAPTIPNEVFIGLISGTTTIGGQTIPNLGALADMIDASSAGNVLSRPTLITLDNEEAKIKVGSNIGVPNGSFQSTAANPGAQVTTITRQDLGTFLQIKPLITQNGAIQLDIYQEDSSLQANTPVNSPNGPSYNSQSIRATLLVDDGQIIALGGLTKDTVQVASNGIPLLDQIPYLGALFSWQTRTHLKENLILFLRPVIIRSKQGYLALTNDRYKYILDQQKIISAKSNGILPSISAVTIDNQLPYKPSAANETIAHIKNNPLLDLRNNNINTLGTVNNAMHDNDSNHEPITIIEDKGITKPNIKQAIKVNDLKSDALATKNTTTKTIPNTNINVASDTK